MSIKWFVLSLVESPLPAEPFYQLGYLDAIAFYCDNFGLVFNPFHHDWPVISLSFEPSPDPPQVPEVSKYSFTL